MLFTESSFPRASFVDDLITYCQTRIEKYCSRSSWPSPIPGDAKWACMEMVNNFIDRMIVDERYRGLTDADRGEVETAVSSKEIFTDEIKEWLEPWILKRGGDIPFIAVQEPEDL